MFMLRNLYFISSVLVLLMVLTVPAKAELVRFAFTGYISTETSNYSSRDAFNGYYTIETDTWGTTSTYINSGGNRITRTNYSDSIIDFEMSFADKYLSFEPDFDSVYYDSLITIQNDQRSDYSNGYVYNDRMIVTIRDITGTGVEANINYVQFDWSQGIFNGAGMPQLLTSTELPTEAIDLSLDISNDGRISDSESNNIFFYLDTMEVVPVPVPASIWLMLSGLGLIFGSAMRVRPFILRGFPCWGANCKA